MRMILLTSALALTSACGGSNSALPTTNDQPSITERDKPPVPFGKSGGTPGVAVNLTSVEQRKRIGAAGLGPAASADETFVVIRYRVKNLAAEPLSSTDRPSVALIDGDGRSYESDSDASILESGLNNDIQDTATDLNHNVSAKTTMVWKVDKKAFDRATWRLKVAFDTGASATLTKAAKWPLDTKAAPPVVFALK